MIALFRTEFVKASVRKRSLIIALLLVGLPTLICFGINSRSDNRERDRGEGLFRLAHQSGLMVPAAVLAVMSAFLLIVIAATIAGDSIAGDASSGNLRYLLMRPVNRVRLLVAKMAVAGLLIWVSTLLVAVAALVAGIAFFGAHPVNVAALSGTGSVGASFQLTSSMLLERGALAAAYVALGYTALLALGTFFSTLTDTPAGAIGATIGVYIVSEIMDGITQFGTLRYGFPTHYLDAWRSMFTANSFSRDMIAGGVVQLCWASVFAVAATVSFRRKDIRS